MHDDDKRKEELRNFVDSMVDDNQEQAGVHFHSYLEDRMKGLIRPEVDAELSDGEDADAEDEGSSDKK